VIVGQADGCTGSVLYKNPVSACGELTHAGRRQADTVFMVLDFLWYADSHGFSPEV
jgi:hypothetical protein